jgi:hypothetical protein
MCWVLFRESGWYWGELCVCICLGRCGECCSERVGGTEVNSVCVSVWGDVLSVVQREWVVLRWTVCVCVCVWGEMCWSPQTVAIVNFGSNGKWILVLRVFAFLTVSDAGIKLVHRCNTEVAVIVAGVHVLSDRNGHVQICSDCIAGSLLGWICARTAPVSSPVWTLAVEGIQWAAISVCNLESL